MVKKNVVPTPFSDSTHILPPPEVITFLIIKSPIPLESVRLFSFLKAFKKLNNRTDSSGIGLFIIKKVITSGGGKIWVESEKGVGTTFFFTIPK